MTALSPTVNSLLVKNLSFFTGFFHVINRVGRKETQAVDYLLVENTICSGAWANIGMKEEFNELIYFVVWRACGRITISFWHLRQT
jgi:hypothetical protein